jgi:beta,beta-carotene 9',10'-dioxygenase
MTASWQLGFTDREADLDVAALPVQGAVPAWLRGTLLRNGPASWRLGPTRRLNHWFDGWAMLHAFAIDGARVSYRSRFLSSLASQARVDGVVRRREFASDPPRPWWLRPLAFVHRTFTDNAGVTVTPQPGGWTARTESPDGHWFDPHTLDHRGAQTFADGMAADLVCAHTRVDPADGSRWWVGVRLGARCRLVVGRQARGEAGRTVVATMPVGRPPYMHDLAMTASRVVIPEYPYRVHALRLALGGTTFADSHRWRPDEGTVFTVVDRTTGAWRRLRWDVPCFAYHVLSSRDDGADAVILDICAHPDAQVVAAHAFDRLLTVGRASHIPRWWRLRLDLANDRVERLDVGDHVIDMPAVPPGQDIAAWTTAWGISVDPAASPGWMDRLIRISADGGSCTWTRPGCHPSEPIFVPRPDAGRADDGVLLTVWLDSGRKASHLGIHDATTLEELARAELPCHIPFGFHGAWVPG